MKLRTLLIAALGAALTAGAASATTPAQVNHPRRVEVNHRLTHINHAIRHQRVTGKLTAHQARRLHARTHKIRVQERVYARHNAGHITRSEQRHLNHEATAVRNKAS